MKPEHADDMKSLFLDGELSAAHAKQCIVCCCLAHRLLFAVIAVFAFNLQAGGAKEALGNSDNAVVLAAANS